MGHTLQSFRTYCFALAISLGSAAAANDPGQIDFVINEIVTGHTSGLGPAGIIGVPDVPPPMHG